MFDKDGFPGGIFDLDISPDGKLLAVGYEGSTATILELPTGKQIRILPHDSEVDAVTFSPNGRTLATCSRDLRLWDVRTGALLWARRHHESGPRYATFSPNGNTIAIAVGGDNIGLVDASSGDLQGTLLSDRGAATCLAFSPDGHTLAVGLQSPTAVALWDMRTHQELCAIDTGLWGLLSIAFSPDGKRLIAAGHVANREDMPFGTGQIMEWTFPENPPR
jgi:WD40 repeat protein